MNAAGAEIRTETPAATRLCWGCGIAEIPDVPGGKLRCDPCTDLDERRAVDARTAMVLEGRGMSDGVCRGVTPAAIRHALHDLRRESARRSLSAPDLAASLIDLSLILHVAPCWDGFGVDGDPEMAAFTVRGAGSVTGIARIDRALRRQLLKRGDLEILPCVEEPGSDTPKGRGCFATMRGIAAARRAAPGLGYGWGGPPLQEADEDAVDRFLRKAEENAGLLLSHVHEALDRDSGRKEADELARSVGMPVGGAADVSIVSAAAHALCDRMVASFADGGFWRGGGVR